MTRLRAALMAAITWGRRRPATLAISAIIVALTLVAFVDTSSDWGWLYLSTGTEETFVEHHWWGPVTALFAVDNVGALVLLLAVLLVAVGESERIMGSWRTAVAYVGGGVVAIVLGSLWAMVEETYLDFLPLNAETWGTLSPLIAVISTVMAASAFMGPLWRRRVRLLTTFAALMMLLYAGGANDLFSLFAVPVGLGLGYALGGRPAAVRFARSSHHEIRVILAAIVAIGAVGPLIATVMGTGSGLLSTYGYLSVDPVATLDGQACAWGSATLPCPDDLSVAEMQPAAGWICLLPIVVGLFAAWGILRGRRAALWLAGTLNALMFAGMLTVYVAIAPETISAIAQYQGTGVEEYVWQVLTGTLVAAVAPLLTVLALVLLGRHVQVRTSASARRRFFWTVGGSAFVTLTVAFAGQWASLSGYVPKVTPWDLLLSLPLRLVPPTLLPSENLAFLPQGAAAQVFWYLPAALFWVGVLVATAQVLLSPATVQNTGDRARARAVLERGSGDTLSFMSTWPENAYWFSDTADAAIAYRVRGTVAVTLGGPFGPDAAREAVITEFARFCGDHGWTPVFYSVSDAALPAFAHLGWQRLQVAEEALLDPPEWSTAGKKRQDIRTAGNRASREGVAAVWTSWDDLSFSQRSQIRSISEEWVADRPLPEMGFTLGGVDELTDPEVRLMLATDAEGRIQAVTSWLPHYADGAVSGYVLDFMRRAPQSMNGVMEFLIGATADRLRDEGMTVLSLSGAPLAFTDAGGSGDAQLRGLLDLVGSALEPAYGFRSLLNFKRKFQPRFEPLWMVYPEQTVLPAIAIALTRCYMPQITLRTAARLLQTVRAPRS